MLKLKVLKREKTEKTDEVRATGYVPAVFYGPKEAATSIKVIYSEFEKALKDAGESTIVTLDFDGEIHESLIHAVEYHPVRGTINHADFYVVEKGKKVQVSVPLVFEGIAPAEKNLGGILGKILHEVEIEAMPKDLPHEIIVDISSMVDFESKILASDLKLPSGVELVTEAEEVIAVMQEAKEEDTDSIPIDIASIEVEKKGKKEDSNA